MSASAAVDDGAGREPVAAGSSGAPWDDSRSAAGANNPWLVAVVVSIATFMEVLDTSIANVALPHIAGSLAADIDSTTWVLTSYLVSSAVILPISGWRSEVIGRKRFYMLSVALFTISSAACALAPTLSWLILFRILQGIGGGGLAPSEQTILADTFRPEQRGQAFALYGISVIVAPTLGPTLGGWITDNLTWHWIFLINIPMGLLSLLLVQWLIVDPPAIENERKQRLKGGLRVDVVGFGLVALWLGCLEVMLDRGQQDDWFSSRFITSFAIMSLTGLVLLVPWELTRKDPIVDVRLLFRREFAVSFAVMMAVGAILFSTTQLLPQLLQEQYGFTATWAGLVLMPGGFAMLLIMPVAGQLSGRVAPRYMIMFGLAVVAFSMWHLTSMTLDAGFSYFAVARVYQMIGLPFLFLTVTTAAYEGIPADRTGQASALINVARNIGGSIGISLANALLMRREQFHQSRLVESITPSSLSYENWLRMAKQHLMAQGTAPTAAQGQAIQILGKTVQNQAAALSFIDVFATVALVAVVFVPLGMLLSAKAGGGSGAHGAH